MKAGAENEIDGAFASLVEFGAGGLVVDPDSFFSSRRAQIVALVSRHAVPAIYGHREFVAVGGLMSYGTDDTAMAWQAVIYAGKILKAPSPPISNGCVCSFRLLTLTCLSLPKLYRIL
jgi:putative tryptophan/tyrosine transport system substrate-binding protein